MASKKTYLVTDLGFGDGGKGGVVHKLCTYTKPHTVIKVGGAQGSHGVTYSDGRSFEFSQFGCGTREGVRTHLAHTFVASIVGILKEADVLRYDLGVSDPLDRLTVDPRVLLSTSFHGISSRLKEIARGKNGRGIIGVGIGEASLDAELFPELAIYAADLKRQGLRDKLRAVLEQKRQEVALLYDHPFMTEGEDAQHIKNQIGYLHDEGFFGWVCEEFERASKEVRIVDDDYLRREIFSRDGVVVFEGSHGVLTDRFYGFHPHTTRLRTVPEAQAEAVLRDGGWNGDVVRLGVLRSYQIKHGAGPLVVDTPEMAKRLLPEEFGNPDRYRGQVRTGPLDLVMLRYARDVCGGADWFDGLCVTWCDTVGRLGEFQVCDRYEGSVNPEYFLDAGNLLVSRGRGDAQLRRQETLSSILLTCCPHVCSYTLPFSASSSEVRSMIAGVLKEAVGVPVRMVGFGPSDKDKVLF